MSGPESPNLSLDLNLNLNLEKKCVVFVMNHITPISLRAGGDFKNGKRPIIFMHFLE
jgi:hypothetical protein